MTDFFGVEFTVYVAIAVILYAIREATGVPNRFVPIAGVALGIAFAVLEARGISFESVLSGIQYGAYGVATVASVKYFVENPQ